MTKLENAVLAHPKYQALGEDADKKEKQIILDEITEEVLTGLSANEICAHVQEVYDATVDEYIKNPHTKHIIDELIEFMDMLPEGARVYDVGCGTGRDAFFMYVTNQEFRKGLMNRERHGLKTSDIYSVPTKNLRVVGIDVSQKMIDHAQKWKRDLVNQGFIPKDSWNPFFAKQDMHNFMDEPLSVAYVEGVWSCTALFTHTPRSLLFPAMESVAKALDLQGVFFTSYTSGRAEGRYNKLLLSSTGRIKYFSQPDPDEITEVAKMCGLKLEKQSFSDFEINGKVIKKDLFVSQFFRKS